MKIQLLEGNNVHTYCEHNLKIQVNKAFTSPLTRIRIPNAITKTTKKEREVAVQGLEEDRKHSIEASIVR